MNVQTKRDRSGALAVVLALGVMLNVVAAAEGGTVTYLGQDTSTLANWRTPATAKPAVFDPNGDDVYGSDGYHAAFLSGVGGGVISVQTSLPNYITGVTPTLAGVYSSGGYEWINDPSAASQPTDKATGLWHQGVGTVQTSLFDVTLSRKVSFVLGVISDTHDQQNGYNMDGIGARQTVGGSVDTGLQSMARSGGQAYYEFFAISGVAGDVFTVYGRNSTGGSVTVTGLTFEETPEPSALAMLLGVIALGLLGYLWRRRRS